MFGYIAINKSEMKFKDFDVYQSYYCGLCKCLKTNFGKRGQMTLSYDMAFLAILLTGLYEPDTELSCCNCVAHPLQKHPTRINEFTSYAADMNLILTYYKCKDDWRDEKKKKSYIAARLLRPSATLVHQKYPKKLSVLSSRLRQLAALEQKNEDNLDIMAGLFGEIMAELFAYRSDAWEESLRKCGFFLGKFIYLMDAYEDVEQDIENGSYNPLKDAFKRQDFEEYCKNILTMMIAECSREFEKLPILTHAEILRNILYSGVWCRFEAVTAKRNSLQEANND